MSEQTCNINEANEGWVKESDYAALKRHHDDLQFCLDKEVKRVIVYQSKYDALFKQRDELHDNLYELIDFSRELVSIVKIHSNATGNNFAWAELESMETAIAKAGA